MKELIKKIENWAEERNLIKGSTPQKQFIKLMEEFGELFKAKISFGFCILGLKEAADYFELDFDECVKAAWDEIKDRKGRMIDGVFVKEGDL